MFINRLAVVLCSATLTFGCAWVDSDTQLLVKGDKVVGAKYRRQVTGFGDDKESVVSLAESYVIASAAANSIDGINDDRSLTGIILNNSRACFVDIVNAETNRSVASFYVNRETPTIATLPYNGKFKAVWRREGEKSYPFVVKPGYVVSFNGGEYGWYTYDP